MIHVEYVEGKTSLTGKKLQAELNDLEPMKGILNWTGAPLRDQLVPVLNERSFTDKLKQLQVFQEKDIPIPAFELPFGGDPLWRNTPPHPGWLGRSRFHSACSDFLHAHNVDYWMEPLNIEEEWRVHVGKTKRGNFRVLRTSLRIPTENAHPWIHSFEMGWRWRHGGGDEYIKDLARSASKALDLDLCAVDIARLSDEGLGRDSVDLVLEVNTCPGLADESSTRALYVEFVKERFS